MIFHNGRCLDGKGESCICSACFEFRLQWTQAAGKLASAKHIVEIIRDRAGKRFMRGKDDEAIAIRELADDIQMTMVKPLEDKVMDFIEQSKKEEAKK